MKTPIKLAVFDMAGTAIKNDKVVPELLLKAFLQHGFDKLIKEAIHEKMGYAIPEAIKQILASHTTYQPDFSELIVGKIYATFKAEIKKYCRLNPEISPEEDALEVFETLQQMGIKIGLNTNLDRETTNLLLKQIGWKDHPLIDITVCGDEVCKGRPHPDMILQMMAALGIGSPSEIIKIGGTLADILEGQQSGCLMSVGITNPNFSHSELLTAQPTHILGSLSEIIPLVENELTKTPE
ncbi:HAD hydrolase-like protein [Cyclobacterium qasimii]|nr:HAD hydrolase-like protein [Cyclobacterium qasimii]